MLAYGHYAAAAVTFFFNGFGFLMFLFMAAILRFAPAKTGETMQDQAAREWMAAVMPWGAGLFGIYALVTTASLIYAGVLIRRNQRYRRCWWLTTFNVMTTTNAMLPLGPIAAGFALAYLRKPSVQAGFAGDSPGGEVVTGIRWDLKALSMAAYLMCVQSALGLVVIAVLLLGMLNLPPNVGGPEAQHLEWIRLAVPIFLGALAVYSTGVMGGLGYHLARVERRGLCVGLAIAALLFLPLGTLLGVFALVVLNRPDARATFGDMRGQGLNAAP